MQSPNFDRRYSCSKSVLLFKPVNGTLNMINPEIMIMDVERSKYMCHICCTILVATVVRFALKKGGISPHSKVYQQQAGV